MNNPSETGNDLWAEFAKAARQGPSIYFAPVRGAVMGFLSQWRKTHQEVVSVLPKAA